MLCARLYPGDPDIVASGGADKSLLVRHGLVPNATGEIVETHWIGQIGSTRNKFETATLSLADYGRWHGWLVLQGEGEDCMVVVGRSGGGIILGSSTSVGSLLALFVLVACSFWHGCPRR